MNIFQSVPYGLENGQVSNIKIFFLKSEFYKKAVELAPNVSAEFEQELPKRRAWSLNHLRSYFRAVHGQANTLRKMGRYEESLEKYLQLEKLDPAFYGYTSLFIFFIFEIIIILALQLSGSFFSILQT